MALMADPGGGASVASSLQLSARNARHAPHARNSRNKPPATRSAARNCSGRRVSTSSTIATIGGSLTNGANTAGMARRQP